MVSSKTHGRFPAALLLLRKMIMTQTSVEAQPNKYLKAGFNEPVAKLHDLMVTSGRASWRKLLKS